MSLCRRLDSRYLYLYSVYANAAARAALTAIKLATEAVGRKHTGIPIKNFAVGPEAMRH